MKEVLLHNSSLCRLDFSGLQKSGKKESERSNKNGKTGNIIGPEGASTISEALKENSVLSWLDMSCDNYLMTMNRESKTMKGEMNR